MTTKLTITRMAKTITPMTKLPRIISWPKAWMMWPAPSAPSWPWPRISRVEARFRPSRNRVVTSSTVGKAVNSSGFLISSDGHQDQHGAGDRDRQQHVEQERRDRQDQQDDDADDAERQGHIAARHPAPDVARRSAGRCGKGARSATAAWPGTAEVSATIRPASAMARVAGRRRSRRRRGQIAGDHDRSGRASRRRRRRWPCVAAGAGLVADRQPAGRPARSRPGRSGRRSASPQPLARGGRERVAQQDVLRSADHRQPAWWCRADRRGWRC